MNWGNVFFYSWKFTRTSRTRRLKPTSILHPIDKECSMLFFLCDCAENPLLDFLTVLTGWNLLSRVRLYSRKWQESTAITQFVSLRSRNLNAFRPSILEFSVSQVGKYQTKLQTLIHLAEEYDKMHASMFSVWLTIALKTRVTLLYCKFVDVTSYLEESRF